jgi:aryl-alcohol dehydrogenase-like predicted oxidoreductase
LQVRYVGVSNETAYGVMEFTKAAVQAGLPHIHTIQNSFSMLVRYGWEQHLHEVRFAWLWCRQLARWTLW